KRDEDGQDEAGEHLKEIPAPGHDCPGDQRLVLRQVVEELPGQLVEPGPGEVERRPCQVALNLVKRAPDLRGEHRVVRLTRLAIRVPPPPTTAAAARTSPRVGARARSPARRSSEVSGCSSAVASSAAISGSTTRRRASATLNARYATAATSS